MMKSIKEAKSNTISTQNRANDSRRGSPSVIYDDDITRSTAATACHLPRTYLVG